MTQTFYHYWFAWYPVRLSRFEYPHWSERALAERDAAIEQVEENAGEWFGENAQFFIIAYLRDHGPTPGEVLTDKCKEAGIIPHNDKAFGGVYLSLSKRGIIHKVGTCLRRKGHATSGGNIWGLTSEEG